MRNVLGGHGYCSLTELAYVFAYTKAHRQGRRQSLRFPISHGFVRLFRILAHSPQLSHTVVKRSDGTDLGFRSHGQVTGVMARVIAELGVHMPQTHTTTIRYREVVLTWGTGLGSLGVPWGSFWMRPCHFKVQVSTILLEKGKK